MSTDSAKRLAQLEADVAILRARLNVMSQQRNEALDRAVVSKAAADLQVDGLSTQLQQAMGELKKAAAEIKRLEEQAEAAKKMDAETPAPNGHAAEAEACPQA